MMRATRLGKLVFDVSCVTDQKISKDVCNVVSE